MVGYVYKTTNLVNGKIYIGKHEVSEYDPKYLGSGKILQLAIQKYGKENFKNEVIFEADSIEDLNMNEKLIISQYFYTDGKNNMYNIALGGDGGNVLYNYTPEEKAAFVEKMTKINKERCSTEEFKNKISKATSARYADPEERERGRRYMNAYWAKEENRKKQSMMLRKYHDEHPHSQDTSYKEKPCSVEFNGEKKTFKSIGELKDYLKEELNYVPDHRNLKKMFEDGTKGLPRTFLHKDYKRLNGLLIKLEDK